MFFNRYIILGFFAVFSFSIYSQPDSIHHNLLNSYRSALKHDLIFQAEKADWASHLEDLKIAQASALPQIALSSSISRYYQNIDFGGLSSLTGAPNQTTYTTPISYGISLSQPIFNLPIWKQIAATRAAVKQAQAHYFQVQQNLILRVANAYFDLLTAYESVQLSQAETKAIKAQMRQAKQRYKVGLTAVTDYYGVKAKYHAMVANTLNQRTVFQVALEKLAQITGTDYTTLQGVSPKVLLQPLKPSQCRAWSQAAKEHNYALLAAHYSIISAREAMQANQAKHFPTLNLVGQYYVSKGTEEQAFSPAEQKIGELGVEANFPIYQGGSVRATTRKLFQNYKKALALKGQLDSQVFQDTRQYCLSSKALIAKVAADHQSVIWSRHALKGSKAAYLAGTKTLLDVLHSQTVYYQARRNLVKDIYSYLKNTLQLAYQVGRLGQQNVIDINRLLTVKHHLSLANLPIK